MKIGLSVLIMDAVVILSAVLKRVIGSVPLIGKVLAVPFSLIATFGKWPAIIITIAYVLFFLFRKFEKSTDNNKKNENTNVNVYVNNNSSAEPEGGSTGAKRAEGFK